MDKSILPRLPDDFMFQLTKDEINVVKLLLLILTVMWSFGAAFRIPSMISIMMRLRFSVLSLYSSVR